MMTLQWLQLLVDGSSTLELSAYDLVSTKDAVEDPRKRLQKPLLMQTANGVMEASKRATEKVNTLRSTITPLLLDSTPDVLFVGRSWQEMHDRGIFFSLREWNEPILHRQEGEKDQYD
eukprot:1412230-Amphidinium_carterae.1